MTKRAIKNNINPDRMTKAQLKEVLDDMRDRLGKREADNKRLQKKIKDSNLQLKELHQELGELKRKKTAAPEKNQDLIEEYQQSDQKNRAQIKTLKQEIKELNQNKQSVDAKNKALENKIDELEQAFTIPDNSETDAKKRPSAERKAFLIYFYERQDHFRGKIIHLLSMEDISFRGLDEAAIRNFIASHNPELLSADEMVSSSFSSEEHMSSERKSTEIQKPLFSPLPDDIEHIIENIKFLQAQRVIETGESVSAHLPFSVQARFYLPITPTRENMDIDTSTYGIRVVAMDEAEEKIFASNGTADVLSAGVKSYENEISMPGLEPGKYHLKLFAFAPFAQLVDRQDVELSVST